MPRFDTLIRNATLVDGTGAPRYTGDLAIEGDRIAAIGELEASTATSEIDARGKVLAPGFIDSHAHDDCALLTDPLMPCKTSQGVTTVINGNCGVSLAPLRLADRPPAPIDFICRDGGQFFQTFGSYFSELDRNPAAVNCICLAGHSTMRVGTMDDLKRPASKNEIQVMKDALSRSLDDGAVGLSTGLFYPPASAAPTEEVIELASIMSDRGGLYVTHMRNESDAVVDAVEETLRIGREARVPVLISHHKCAGAPNHGRSKETLALVQKAGADQRVGLDVYPYTASSTMLDSGRDRDAEKVIVTWSDAMPDAGGRDLSDLARQMGCSESEAIRALLPAGGIFFTLSEDDVRRILVYPDTMIGSDGIPSDKHPHPRLWGTFPRVLGKYVRDVGLLQLEEAVRKMTSLTAQMFGIPDRGRLSVGAFADLVLFDPGTIRDTATFTEPTRPSEGIQLVMVNGQAVWQDGQATQARPGRALRMTH